MRKMLLTLLIILSVNSYGWNKKGQEVAIAVAQRHLTEQTKLNISKYMQYDLKEDAVWMDKHKKDELFDLISIQLRDAGYRLAYLLNMYFGE